MSYTKEIKKNEAIFTLTIPKDEVEEGMKHAAEHLAETSKIPGFRPGKAGYETVKQRFGEMKLLEAATEELIRNAFVKALLEEDLETVGQPFFDVVKMAPGNDMVITAKISLFPKMTKLGDFSKVSVKNGDAEPTKEQIAQAKKDLTMMQTKEVRATKEDKLKKGDKTVVDLTMKHDGVVLEGGEGRAHGIYTAEEHYIPGLVDQLIGAKEGEKLAFKLSFPKEHYQAHLAGKDIEFEIAVNEIFHLEVPEIDDTFAKNVGLKDKKELEEKLVENIRQERAHEDRLRVEKEMLQAIIKTSTFEDIPDTLLNQEIQTMIAELKNHVSQRGMKLEDYLQSIKKSMDELKMDFTPTALERVKVAILLKELAVKEKISPTEERINEELDKIAEQYKDDEQRKGVYEPRYREYITQQLRNRMVIDWLKEKIVK
jgi:trigger factor